MRYLLSCCIIAFIGLTLRPEQLSAQANEGHWWETDFTIGLNLDPPQQTSKSDWSSEALWDSVRNAGFNLSVGLQYKHGQRKDTVTPAKRASNAGVKYLYHDGNFMTKNVAHLVGEISDLFSENPYLSGVHVKDEPTQTQTDTVTKIIIALDKSFPDKLFFVNLFPTYYFPKDSFNKYEEYARAFLSDTIPLQVVCFDNYFPNSLFTDFPAADSIKRYYSNLSLLRRMSGNRPLWSYVLTTEKRLIEKSLAWQQAFIRLSAFAPLAYGCKGLIYYTFDTRDGGFLFRDYSYNNKSGDKSWKKPLYFCAQDQDAELFIGRFRSNNTGRYDVALKSDSLRGSWWVKFAEIAADSLHSDTWDRTFSDFGLRNNTEAFIGDWDNNGLDEFLAFVRNTGRLLVSRTLGGWQHNIILTDFPQEKAASIDRSRLEVGRFNNNNLSDFCIAWPEEGTRYTVRTYLDYQTSTGTFASYEDTTYDSLMHLYVCPYGNLYAFTQRMVYKFDSESETWDNGIALLIKSGEKPDHFWIEKGFNSENIYLVQTTEGEMYSKNVNKDSLNQPNSAYSSSELALYTLMNNITGDYDIYGVQHKKNYGYPALLDYNQNTTERFAMVKKINRYIHENLAPIVFNSRWAGAWHSTRPSGEIDSLVQVVDHRTPLLKSMDEGLLAGFFEQSDTVYYLFVVNQQETTRPTCRIQLRCNRVGRVSMLPRIDGADNTFTATFRPDSLDTELTWENMAGGECVALRITTPPCNIRVKDDFDSDGLSDLLFTDTLSNNNVRQRILLSSSNYTDTLTYTFPFTSQGVPAYTASANFDGDGRGDISLLDGASGKWWFRMSRDEYALTAVDINTDSVAMPFVGDYNGDNCADLCYRKDKEERLFIQLSDNGIFTEDSITYIGYGTSHSTRPVCGDYDGNGSDDIALYRSDHLRQLLIDNTIPTLSGLALGEWNSIYSLDTIAVSPDVCDISVTSGDFDGDGLSDLCAANFLSNRMYINFGYNGFGSWDVSAPITVHSLYTPYEVNSGDYNNDGTDDVCYVYKRVNSPSRMLFSIDFACNGFHGEDMQIPSAGVPINTE